jgi:hypothetical protein
MKVCVDLDDLDVLLSQIDQFGINTQIPKYQDIVYYTCDAFRKIVDDTKNGKIPQPIEWINVERDDDDHIIHGSFEEYSRQLVNGMHIVMQFRDGNIVHDVLTVLYVPMTNGYEIRYGFDCINGGLFNDRALRGITRWAILTPMNGGNNV